MTALVLALALAAPRAPELHVSHRKVRTDDGAALALYRYSPPGEGVGRPPVLLVPDLGFGREVFDADGQGLARWLASRGALVFVAELRGQGKAEASKGLATAVRVDLPAVLAAIRKERAEPVDVVAHGWMGTLVLAATVKELEGQVRRVVALNTPVLAEVPSALVEQFLSGGGKLADLTSTNRGAGDFELMFAMASKFPPRVLSAVETGGVRDLGETQATELLGWMKSGDLGLAPMRDGPPFALSAQGASKGAEHQDPPAAPPDTVLARLRAYDRPTLQLLALADGWASPELCSPLREVSKAKITLQTFSRFVHGTDYSHVSVLLGQQAPATVFPRIDDFFRAEETP